MAAQYAPAPPTTTRSPISGRATSRGASASGSPGAGVRMSPDSQHGPTNTTRAVERGAGHLRHAGVELGEEVAVLPGVDHVDAGGDHDAGVGDEVGPRLDLEMEPAAGAAMEADERLPHDRPDG